MIQRYDCYGWDTEMIPDNTGAYILYSDLERIIKHFENMYTSYNDHHQYRILSARQVVDEIENLINEREVQG